jgi:hypothetical protein
MRSNLIRAAALLAVCTAMFPATHARGEVKVEKVAYLNLPNCYKLSYSFPGEDNILAEMPDAVVKTDLGDWKPLGGHRLWTAPEAMPRSYAPDSSPIEFKQEGANTVRLTQKADEKTGIQKEMVITLADEGPEVTILHRLTNRNMWAADVATWGLTIMNGGGVTIIPQEPYVSHDDVNGLLPARPLIMWPYTDFSDPRWTLGKRYLRLKTDEALTEPQKAGVVNKVGWTGYARNKTLFVKRFGYQEGMKYPDFGANCETYTAGNFMEVETLGPLRKLNWGETTEHTEKWRLYKNVEIGDTEATLDAALQPLIAQFPATK